MKNISKLFITTVILFGIGVSTIQVQATDTEDPFETIEPLPINVNNTLISGVKQYKNPELARTSIYLQYESEIQEFILLYQLGELNDANFDAYKAALFIYSSDEHETGSFKQDFLKFIDIYENYKLNNEIFSLVNLYNSTGDSNLLYEIDLLTPGNSAKIMPKTPSARVGNYNHQAAINYAITWYAAANVGANTPYVYYVNGDCTNFVSQCLAAGGKSFTNYWWCYGKYNHSNAWVNANQFVNIFDTYDSLYEGNGRRTGNHFVFTQSISAGDVIALDFGGDWVWDHVGIVTDWNNYIGSYGYYDYKVAQHTSNYWAWTSSSTNGWEDDNGTYYWAKVNIY